MYPLVESLRAENGVLFLLAYHQERMEKSYRHWYGKKCPFDLAKAIEVPQEKGRFKVRFLYHETHFLIQIEPYKPREINALKLVEVGEYSYAHKATDRTIINSAFAQRGSCDDVLMLKNGKLTDLSYANLLLWDGRQWVTPEIPLLEGVQRQYLLDEKKISLLPLHKNDLADFSHFQWVNALNPFAPERKTPLDFKE